MTFQRTASGAGLIVLERFGVDVEATFGIGESGQPLCPRGHGEMLLADEQIPVAEAISQAAAANMNGNGRGTPVQQQLLPSPPFNFAGALQAIAEKNRHVKSAHDAYEAAKEEASDCRKAWEREAKQLQDLIDQLETRERDVRQEAEQRAAEEATAARAQACSFEREDAKPCPICRADFPVLAVAALDETTTVFADRQSVAHRRAAQDVELTDLASLMDLSSADLVAQALEIGGWYGGFVLVDAWSLDERRAALRWVSDGASRDAAPTSVGVPHIAAPAGLVEQCCADCGARLMAFADQEGAASFPAGALVGSSCTGVDEHPEAHPSPAATECAEAPAP